MMGASAYKSTHDRFCVDAKEWCMLHSVTSLWFLGHNYMSDTYMWDDLPNTFGQ